MAHTRRFRGWVTDAVYMGDAGMVAVATDCRDLHFVSVSTARVFEDVHLFGTDDCTKPAEIITILKNNNLVLNVCFIGAFRVS